MSKSGEITIFLSLLCIVLCGFIGALIRSSKLSFVRTRIECVTDIAIISSFSEYNRKLFDRFHLLFVDTTYKGVTSGGSEEFREHFEQYLEANLTEEYGLNYMSSEISDVSFASDNEYREVVNQIREYMITKQAMGEDESNESILDAYIELCIPYEESNLADFTYDEKLELIIKTINEEMKEEYGSYFDFDKHICFGKFTVYVSSENGKVYECTKEYYLSK